MRSWHWILLLVLALGLACGNSNSGGSASSSGGGSSEQVEEAAEEAKAFKIGEDVTVGDVRWKILEVQDLGKELKSDNQFIQPKSTSGKFVMVKFELENRKAEAASYAGVDMVDSQGRTFKPYDEKIGFIEEGELCVLEQLNPNLAKACTEIFELPGDATGLRLKVGDLELFGGDEAEVDLGM